MRSFELIWREVVGATKFCGRTNVIVCVAAIAVVGCSRDRIHEPAVDNLKPKGVAGESVSGQVPDSLDMDRAQNRPPADLEYATLIRQGTQLLAEGRSAEALQRSAEAASREPARYEAHALAALILHSAKRSSDAQAALAEARRRVPASARWKIDNIERTLLAPTK